jgi:hypothetical protein
MLLVTISGRGLAQRASCDHTLLKHSPYPGDTPDLCPMFWRKGLTLLIVSCSLHMLQAQSDSLPPAIADTLILTKGIQEPIIISDGSARDTLDWRQRHSPKKASILSAVLPGAGQIYNRKYWKAPIVWGGLATSVYFIRENNSQFLRYKAAYLALVDGDPDTVDEFEGQFSPDQVLEVVDTYRRWRDLSYIAFGLVYMLNVIDASVDAHFVRFDVSPDLSLRMGPSLPLAAQGAAGLSFSLAIR